MIVSRKCINIMIKIAVIVMKILLKKVWKCIINMHMFIFKSFHMTFNLKIQASFREISVLRKNTYMYLYLKE